MQFPLACTVISAEVIEASTNPRTGERYAEKGEIYILTSDRGKPVTKKVTCSVTMAREMENREVGLSVGDTVKETVLPLDISEYKLDNGKQGISLKLVEERDAAPTAFLDTVGLSKPKPDVAARQPEAKLEPAGAGAR